MRSARSRLHPQQCPVCRKTRPARRSRAGKLLRCRCPVIQQIEDGIVPISVVALETMGYAGINESAPCRANGRLYAALDRVERRRVSLSCLVILNQWALIGFAYVAATLDAKSAPRKRTWTGSRGGSATRPTLRRRPPRPLCLRRLRSGGGSQPRSAPRRPGSTTPPETAGGGSVGVSSRDGPERLGRGVPGESDGES